MDNDKENDIIPLKNWISSRTEQYAKTKKELAKKLEESYVLADTMSQLAKEQANIAIACSIRAVIHGLELLILR